MAIIDTCVQNLTDSILGCDSEFAKEYYQEVVLINKTDIETYTPIVDTNKVTIQLASGKKGVKIQGFQARSVMKGWFEKTTTDNGQIEYTHKVNIVYGGLGDSELSNLRGLDNGDFVAVIRKKVNGDDQYMVFGLEQGMTTADYTYDISESAGVVSIELMSRDTGKERTPARIYFDTDIATTKANFDAQFLAP